MMCTKALLTVLAASATDVMDTSSSITECTSVLQKNNFRDAQATLAAKRHQLEEIEEVMTQVSTGQNREEQVEAVKTKIAAVDSAMSHEREIEELEAMKSKLSMDGYHKFFPVDDPVTKIAEKAVDEEIKHQKVQESLAMKMESLQPTADEDAAENYLLNKMTDAIGVPEATGVAMAQLANLASSDSHDRKDLLGALIAKARTSESLASYKQTLETLESTKAKLREGGFKQLPVGDALTGVAEEALDEEIKYQNAHKSLIQELDQVPMPANHRNTMARNVLLSVITKKAASLPVDDSNSAKPTANADAIIGADANSNGAAAGDGHAVAKDGFKVSSEHSGIMGMFESLASAVA